MKRYPVKSGGIKRRGQAWTLHRLRKWAEKGKMSGILHLMPAHAGWLLNAIDHEVGMPLRGNVIVLASEDEYG